jgi:hypothetical protein
MTLHVTNGDYAADGIRAAGVEGQVLPWRDVLHEGPVPAGLPLAELSALRASWIAAQGEAWGDSATVAGSFAERDTALAGEYDEIVLWFEHDLYDQLQLIQLLDLLAEHGTRLSLVNPPEYLGSASTERLAELFTTREPVTSAQLELGARAWAAFRAPEPGGVQRVVEEGAAPLPFLAAALRRHLEQFPSVRDGLSRTERQILESVAGGALTVRDAFVAHNQREDPIWLGDAPFFGHVQALASGSRPLLRIEPAPRWIDQRLELTDAAREVLGGRLDRVRANGIDRWLGGVHLQGDEARWRWDGERQRLVLGSSGH